MAASAACRADITRRNLGPMTFHSSSEAWTRVLISMKLAISPKPGNQPPPKGSRSGAGREAAPLAPSRDTSAMASTATQKTMTTPNRHVARMNKTSSSLQTAFVAVTILDAIQIKRLRP